MGRYPTGNAKPIRRVAVSLQDDVKKAVDQMENTIIGEMLRNMDNVSPVFREAVLAYISGLESHVARLETAIAGVTTTLPARRGKTVEAFEKAGAMVGRSAIAGEGTLRVIVEHASGYEIEITGRKITRQDDG